MQKSDSYRDFLAQATAIPGDDQTAGEEPRDRYVRFHYGADQDHTAPILDQEDKPLKLRFAYPGTTLEQLDAMLAPFLENFVESYHGFIWYQCVDPALQFKVVARDSVRCSGERRKNWMAEAESATVRAMKTSGVDAMWNAHAEVVKDLKDAFISAHHSLVEVTGAQVTREAAYARLEATIEAAMDWNKEAVRWASIERLGLSLGPPAIQALHGIGAAVAAGKPEDLGERPATGADRVAWDLRACDLYARDALGQITTSPMEAIGSPNVQLAAAGLVATIKRASQLAEAAGIDLAAMFAAALVLFMILPGCGGSPCQHTAALIDVSDVGGAVSWTRCPAHSERLEVYPADHAGERWLVMCVCPGARPPPGLLAESWPPAELR